MLTRRAYRLLLIGLTLLLVLAPISTVSAQPPIRETYLFEPFTIEDQCDFPVYWEMTTQNSYINVFSTPNGGFTLVTGLSRSTMTNTDTDKSIEFLIAGNMEWFNTKDGSFVGVMNGPHINFFYNLPGLTYIQGNQMIKFDPEGYLVENKITGKVTDMCALLGN
jgi:hypothetical protein